MEAPLIVAGHVLQSPISKSNFYGEFGMQSTRCFLDKVTVIFIENLGFKALGCNRSQAQLEHTCAAVLARS